MNKEKTQDSANSKSNKACQVSPAKTCHKDTKPVQATRRYDIVDLLMVSIYNAVVFSCGLGLGWILWFTK